MIGEGYGNMKELAAEMRSVQVAFIRAFMTAETQQGEIQGSETHLLVRFT